MSSRKRRELEAVESINTDLRSKLQAARKDLVDSQSIENKAQNLVTTYRTQLDESSALCASFENTNKNQSLELVQYATKIRAQECINQTTIQERDHARAKSNDLQVEIERLTTRTQDLETCKQSLADKLLETEGARARLRIAKISADDRDVQLSTLLHRLKHENRTLKGESAKSAVQNAHKLADKASAEAKLLEVKTALTSHVTLLETQLQGIRTRNDSLQEQLSCCQAELASKRLQAMAQTLQTRYCNGYEDMDFSSHVKFSRSEKDVRISANWWQGELRIDIREFYGRGVLSKKVSRLSYMAHENSGILTKY